SFGVALDSTVHPNASGADHVRRARARTDAELGEHSSEAVLACIGVLVTHVSAQAPACRSERLQLSVQSQEETQRSSVSQSEWVRRTALAFLYSHRRGRRRCFRYLGY